MHSITGTTQAVLYSSVPSGSVAGVVFFLKSCIGSITMNYKNSQRGIVMRKILSLAAVILCIAAMAGCKKTGSSSDGKYEIKAGSYTYAVGLPGMAPVNTTTYFDDYGSKECSETKMEMKLFGISMNQHTRNITKDGYAYTLDMIKKTGTKMKIEAMGPDMKAGYASLALAMKDTMDIKELGTEDILGKSCKKVSIAQKGGPSMGTFWIWKNITLKMENKDPHTGISMNITATKIEELDSVPADMFVIPSDFKITEAAAPAAGE
jgi:uncharacterized lipoprotein YehR (DUF1307 family)